MGSTLFVGLVGPLAASLEPEDRRLLRQVPGPLEGRPVDGVLAGQPPRAVGRPRREAQDLEREGRVVYTLEKDCHTDWVSCVRFSPAVQSPVIVSGGWDN